VALKVLGGRSLDLRAAERFRREAEVAARLHHTNIVPVFEAGRDGDLCYYAMQLIAGWSLAQAIARLRVYRRLKAAAVPRTTPDRDAGTPPAVGDDTAPTGRDALPPLLDPALPPAAYYRCVAEVGVQAAAALAHAHERRVCHRDVKPSNLLLDRAGTVWVTDFGLVKTEDSDLTSTGAMVGTLRYLAPERLLGLCDARADVYSLGLTLYELLTLQPAFPEADQVGLLQAIPHREPVPPHQHDRRVPRDLETIIL
jgi:serine/threonine protein kinase